jgi:hypothetical protein
MLISHQHRFVMFLPWKTASQTMVARLEPFNESPYSRFFDFNPHLNRVVHQHITCADFCCLPEHKLGYALASFVRNPYDRVYSGFRQLKKDIADQPLVQYPSDWIRRLVQEQLAANEAQIKEAEGDFNDWVSLLDEGQILEQGRNTNFPLHPSHYWTHLAGRTFADFVGRVESFEADFARFCQLVGLSQLPQINTNVVELSQSSSLGDVGYRYVDRMSAESIQKINSMFAEDFDLFGYSRVDPRTKEAIPLT